MTTLQPWDQFAGFTTDIKGRTGANAQFWVSDPFIPGNSPPTQEIELDAAVSQGATVITLVNDITLPIYTGTIIDLGGLEFIQVTADLLLSAPDLKTLNVLPIQSASIPINTTGQTPEAYLPVISAETWNNSGANTEVEGNVFSGGGANFKDTTSVSYSGSLAGSRIPTDPGYAALEQAQDLVRSIKFLFYRALDLTGDAGQATVSLSTTDGKNAYAAFTANLSVSGAVTRPAFPTNTP